MALTRQATGAIVVALLAVIGVGLIAATLTTTYQTQLEPGSGSGVNGGQIHEGGPEDPTTNDPTNTTADPDPIRNEPISIPAICIPILTEPGVILGIVAAFALIVAVAYRQFELLGAAFTIYLVGLPITLGYALATQCPQGGGPDSPRIPRDMNNWMPGAPGGGSATAVPPSLLIGLFAIAGLGAAVMLLTASGDETVEPVGPAPGDDGAPDLAQFAAAAGTAADRIEASQASVDNAVYRAWREMTGLLEVSNGREERATTSGEFADAAIAAGLDAGDVERLTRLFEEVRYGAMDPEPREELAVETLRAIEVAYGLEDASVDEASVDEASVDEASAETPSGEEVSGGTD